jgi:hypothetical protein
MTMEVIELPLTKEKKIILLEVLQSGKLTQSNAEKIAAGFNSIEFTDEQFKQALEKIKPKNIR